MAKQSHRGVELRMEGPRQGVFKLALGGRLDSSNTGGVWRQATAAVSGAKAPSVVVDAGSIEYCDGAGIALLVQLRQLQSQAGGTLQIDGLRPEFANLLTDAVPKVSGEAGGEVSQGGVAVEIGEATVELWRDIQILVSFIGELVIGLAYAALNQWSDALDCYQQAVKYNTEDVWFWHNCGEAWMALGKYERAIEAFEQALTLDPTHEPTRRQLQQARDLLQTEE